MMNNEVYIDGVDVSECEHLWKDNSVIELNFCRINFDNNYFSNGIPCCDKCNKHPDCYFKQLQRAKADYSNLLKLYSNEQYKRKSCEQRLNEIKDIIEYYKNSPVEINKNVNRIIEGYKNE